MASRRILWIILILVLLGIFIDLPKDLPWKISKPTLEVDLLGFKFQRDLEIKKGLDLAGGTYLLLEADMNKVDVSDREAALESLRGILERRVNLFGVSEPIIQTTKTGGQYRVIVELAGVTDINQATELVGKTADLTFRELIDATRSAITNLSGKDLKFAKPSFKSDTGEPIVELTFNQEGEKKFEEITKRNLNKQLAIFLDDQILMAPTIQTIISGGQAIISGGFTAAKTKEFAILLNSGALPAPVKIIEQRTIGATLGQESINKSLIAGMVGLVTVGIFMIGSYGRLGFFADLALIIYSLFTLAIFKLIPVTLTLAGIAGFILSIGMAVDANILIFERMKEEIRWGRNKLAAIELGFIRAFPSIRDSNASSLITCAILYWFGTGSVRGFAVTLAIGITISLFTAVVVTKTFLRVFQKYV